MEGPSFMAPQEDRTPYSGASSSKLKARKGTVSAKRTATPYERPAVGRRASALPAPLVHRERGWTSQVVHSASRILTRSATFLFSSLFKRQAPAIAAAPGISGDLTGGDIEGPVPEDVPPLEIVRPSGEVEILEDTEVGASTAERIPERVSLEASDLENILKEKDLTREQCERYIKLIQTKYIDGESQQDASPQKLFSNHEEHSGPFNLESQDCQPMGLPSVHVRKCSSQALVPVADRPARPRGVRFSNAVDKREIAPRTQVSRPEHYTPIQQPISGGREFLKSRATAANDSPLARGLKDSSPTRSLNLRGPSIIPSANPKRKSNSETMDLTCFRKMKSRDSFKMDIPLVPGQSARTARKILDTLDRRPSFKEVRDPGSMGKPENLLTRTPSAASTLKENSDVRRTETILSRRTENANSSSTSLHSLTAFATPSAFTFPSTGFGAEPPTPKIPSPTSDDARAKLREPQLKNGLISPLTSWKDNSLDKIPSSSSLFGNGTTSFLDDNGFDFDKMAARAEKATSILDATFSASPTLTASPSFSDKTSNHSSPGSMPAAFEPGSSSTIADSKQQQAMFPDAASGKQFGLFSSSTTATLGITAGQTKENSIFQASKTEQFSVGAQSLAPPDTNSPNPSNGGFSVVEKNVTRRKKSVKRMK